MVKCRLNLAPQSKVVLWPVVSFSAFCSAFLADKIPTAQRVFRRPIRLSALAMPDLCQGVLQSTETSDGASDPKCRKAADVHPVAVQRRRSDSGLSTASRPLDEGDFIASVAFTQVNKSWLKSLCDNRFFS